MQNTSITHEHGGFQEVLESLFKSLFGLQEGDALLEFLAHFTYDLLRTFGIFLVVLFAVSYFRTYIPVKSVQKAMASINSVGAVILACAAGFISSTCICTNVPMFLGFLAFGIPLNLAVTYLISASLLNLSSLISMAAIVGWDFTWAYIICSVLIAVIAGLFLSLFKQERYLNRSALPNESTGLDEKPAQKQRIHFAAHEVRHTLKDQWVYLLAGVLLSAVIMSFVDLNFVKKLSGTGFIGVLAVNSAGLVLHTDIISMLPVVSTLLRFQMPYGILYALMASMSFFSIPMVIMVKKVLKTSYIAILWATMYVLILAAGGLLLLVA